MTIDSREWLRQLGNGASIDSICRAAGITRSAFDDWWQAETRRRLPPTAGTVRLDVRQPVHIDRDSRGMPHIRAENDDDLFVGFGYAQAQDRLFQLDYLRRRGSGRLAEILGADGAELDLLARTVGIGSVLELDLLARTVGIRRIAEAEWLRLPEETRRLLEAFSRGINAWIDQAGDCLPIEFDLLDYRPEPWSPLDCLTIEGEFRWYLTGRFPVIVIPELARRVLGDSPLYRAFLQVEEDEESIVPPGSYPAGPSGQEPVGTAAGDPDGGQGSNNWVVAGGRSARGRPLLASDPHIAFDAVSCWYEAHLCGGSFDVAGAAYVGMPAILFGRNPRVAWGCTNNICSQRDLYQEKTDPSQPNCFLYDGRWEPARQREEVIAIRNAAPWQTIIRLSRNGPIVDEVLPPPARRTGPVALKWLGAYQGGWLTALLGMNRARSADEFRQALRPWYVPTFNVVFADVDGHIGYQAAGRIPVRTIAERGYRPGWLPEHQWQGLIPFDQMPHLADPPRGWIATANNRPAPPDFPYPLSGTWNDGLRARRIRELLEARPVLTRQDLADMQRDARSLRAVRCLPGLVQALAAAPQPRSQEALRHLQAWDAHMEPDRIGAALFEVFFAHWTRTVARQRFTGETARFVAGAVNGLAAALLTDDPAGWFEPGKREEAIRETMREALAWLEGRLGPDLSRWQWGSLHTLRLRHILSGRGDLGTLLDRGGQPVPGNAHTVCNTGLGPDYESRTGANFRLLADLASSPPELWAVNVQGQSGHPASPHYADQFPTWFAGKHYRVALTPTDTEAASRLTLQPPGAW